MRYEGLSSPIDTNWRGLVDTIQRRGTPSRVFHMELFQDAEIRDAVAERFGLTDDLDPNDPHYERWKYIAVQRFCGFDYVRVALDDLAFPLINATTEDTAGLKRSGGRTYRDEHVGPITTREDFETFPWPNATAPAVTRTLEWYQEHLPEDMCIVSGSMSHFCEYLTWLMGYEAFSYALYDDRKLVEDIADRLVAFHRQTLERYLEYDRVRMVFASDDMGYKTGLLFSAEDMTEFVLRPHKIIAERTHAAGLPYLLHSCGNLSAIIDYLIDEVKIDAKHSFEDTIEDVRQVKHTYGRRTALLGGIDVDFLCRSTEDEIRRRVRETLDVCQPGGGYCLGTGNSVTNYIPLDNYLAMVDEGRLYGRG